MTLAGQLAAAVKETAGLATSGGELKRWGVEFERMFAEDGASEETIGLAIHQAHYGEDGWWRRRQPIMDAWKLAHHFRTLVAQSRAKPRERDIRVGYAPPSPPGGVEGDQ